MATMAELRTALETNLKAAYPEGVQVLPYMVTELTPPAIEIRAGAIDPHRAMNGGYRNVQFLIRAYVSMSVDIGSQKVLDTFREPGTSIQDALEAEPTLGGLADDLIVGEFGEDTTYVRGGRPEYLGFECAVDVIVSGA